MVDHGSKTQQGAATLDNAEPPNLAKVPSLLKGFVIISGVMILLGVILLIVMILVKASSSIEGNGQSNAGGTAIDAPSPPVDLALPAGTRVEQVHVDGRRLVLLAQDQESRQYLAVVDALSGERLSLIRVTPAE